MQCSIAVHRVAGPLATHEDRQDGQDVNRHYILLYDLYNPYSHCAKLDLYNDP